uniref:Uncharacterized protein n=1 Tax=Arundo donax TaxID=35708 RepID=A0A0A9H0S2_ARUDO
MTTSCLSQMLCLLRIVMPIISRGKFLNQAAHILIED